MFGGIREILPEVSHTGEQVRSLILALPRFMGPNLGRGGRREGQEEELFISPLQQRALWENTLHCSSRGRGGCLWMEVRHRFLSGPLYR